MSNQQCREWDVELASQVKEWMLGASALAADALIDHGLLKREDVNLASRVICDEIFTRLLIGDRPPTMG